MRIGGHLQPFRQIPGGGSILVNQLPHYLDLGVYLCGMPERVFALNRHGAYRDITVENDVTVLAEYPGGSTGLDGLHQVELANAIQLSGWVGEMMVVPCDSDRYDRELKRRMEAE